MPDVLQDLLVIAKEKGSVSAEELQALYKWQNHNSRWNI
jgi:hypothetical protein